LPRAVSALELSLSAERIVAAAPKLLAVGDQRGQRQISTELDAESGRLLATVDSLGSSDVYLPTSGIEPIVSALASDLAALGELVARRLTVAEQISARRRSITLVGSEVDRLLAPWIEIIESEIAVLSAEAGSGPGHTVQRTHLSCTQHLRRPGEGNVNRHMLRCLPLPAALMSCVHSIGTARRETRSRVDQLRSMLQAKFICSDHSPSRRLGGASPEERRFSTKVRFGQSIAKCRRRSLRSIGLRRRN